MDTSDTPGDFRVIPRLRRRRDRVRGGTILPERHLPPWTVQDPNRSGSRPRLAARPPLHECVSFPGPLPGARQENPQVRQVAYDSPPGGGRRQGWGAR